MNFALLTWAQIRNYQGLLLLTHGSFNPGMDKQSHDQENVG